MRAGWSRWVIALRIARRGSLQSWGRSLLVIALIAAPVAALSAAGILIPSTQSTLQERIRNTLGSAQAKLTVVADPTSDVQQGVEGGYDYLATGDGTSAPRFVDPRTVLPRSMRVLAIGGGAGTFRTPTGVVSLAVQTGPTWDRSLDGGPYVLLSGRRPAGPTEVLVSPATLRRLGTRLGATIRMLKPAPHLLTVVGTARDRSLPGDALTVFGAAALIPSAASPNGLTFYVPTTPVGWTLVERLNRAGTTVFSRQVLQHPPALPAARQFGGGGPNFATVAVVVIALVFTVLEVGLLAGAAFAVGARLQQRTLATVASVGAERAMLRRVVTASGVVLGAAGGLAGVGLGFLGAVTVMRLTDDGSWSRYPGLHVPWPVLAGAVAFAVLVGWLSALVPARAAGRIDVVAALRGARAPHRIGRRPIVGAVLLAAGIALTLAGGGLLLATLQGSAGSSGAGQLGALALLAGGPVLAQIGVVLCAGLVLRSIARLLSAAPLPARLAARDASRNLGRAVPAVAAVMTTVFLASFAMSITNSVATSSAARYLWGLAQPGQAQSDVVTPEPTAPSPSYVARWASTLRHDLPVARSATLTWSFGTDSPQFSTKGKNPFASVHFPAPANDCDERARLDLRNLRCGPFTANGGSGNSAQNAITIGTADGLALLLGHRPSSSALDALATGGAVALRSGIAPGGTATLDWYAPAQMTGDDPLTKPPLRRTTIPTAVDLPVHPIDTSLYITPSTARALGIVQSRPRVLLEFTRPPTDAEIDATNLALGALANTPDATGLVSLERGPQDYGSLIAWYLLAACLLIAISAGATAIGLARVDGRADDVTFAAVGAPPRIRRSIALVQALIICGTGAVLGTSLGLLPAAAIGGATTSYTFAPPLLQLLLTAVGIPLVIAIGSWLLVGHRTDLARRPAIA